jgi:hypothetical protein
MSWAATLSGPLLVVRSSSAVARVCTPIAVTTPTSALTRTSATARIVSTPGVVRASSFSSVKRPDGAGVADAAAGSAAGPVTAGALMAGPHVDDWR